MKQLLLLLLFSSLYFLEADSVENTTKNVTQELFDEFDDEFEISQPMKESFDPLSGYNNVMTRFNDTFFTSVLTPTAKGYAYIVPEAGRESISNFFDNLLFPVRFVNNLLQLKFHNAGEEFARFGINSTIGLLGLFDPAKSHFDLKAHEEDFGQTLGFYGVGGGFHIVLPFLGPSNLRDTVGLFADATVDPLYSYEGRGYTLVKRRYETIALKSFGILNDYSLQPDQYENLKKDALLLYPFLRDLYEQRRKKLVEE